MTNLNNYFDTIELTFKEIKIKIKNLYKDNEFSGVYPQDYLKSFVFKTKITNTIIIMKINNLTKDEIKFLIYDGWKETKTNIFKWTNSNNIFIIDANTKSDIKEDPYFKYKCEIIEYEYPEIYKSIITDLGYIDSINSIKYKNIFNEFKLNYKDLWKEL